MTNKRVECMLCGQLHKGSSSILKKHISEYYRGGGTFSLSQWKRR